jgi:MFS family permease
VGWVQQWSSLGQFAGPPLVAWVASRAGGWQYTGWVTGACSLAGLALVVLLPRLLRQPAAR